LGYNIQSAREGVIMDTLRR